MEFSKRLQKLNTSIFSSLDEAKNKAIKEGKKVYDYTIGSPKIAPNQAIIDTMKEEISKPSNYMYSIHDTLELKNSIATYYQERYHVSLDPNNEVMSLHGSQEGLAHIALALCDEGDYVLIPAPSYPAFANGAILANAQIYEMPMLKENNYLINFADIDEEVATKAKLMIVSYPNNPTGAIASDEWFIELIAFAKKYDIVVLHDNAYSDLVFDGKVGKSFLAYEGSKDIGIEFNSFSKSYGMAGARIGIAVGNVEIIAALKLLKSNIDYGMFLPIQKSAITALSLSRDVIAETCATYQRRRDYLVECCHKIGWKIDKSAGTMFVWAKIPDKYQSSEEFALALFNECQILVTPGSAFGKYGEGYVRMALVIEDDELKASMEVLANSKIFS